MPVTLPPKPGEPQTVTANKPVMPLDAPTEREKLLEHQLELQREKTAFEKEKLQQELALERKKGELEREKRSRIDEEHEKSRRAADATKYSDSEFDLLREAISDNGNTLGTLLLARTHPTGTYASTEKPAVSRSAAKDVVTVNITVHWSGVTDTPYATTYSFRVTKRGLDRLEVLHDSALFKIDPQFLKTAELDLRTAFDSQ